MEYTVEQIAKVCHETNRSYCQSIGDNSQPSWEDAPEWQKESARSGVRYRIANPTVTPEQIHEEWCRVKVETGWKYGETKNPETREHPCLVPYDELPANQKTKDTLFSKIVDSMTKDYPKQPKNNVVNYLKCVELFHKTFKAPVLEVPQIPNADRVKLRLSLLKEELKELEEAIGNADLVEVADAFCDLQYVLSGAILEFGLKNKFDELFLEVQRSNMSKACRNETIAQVTCVVNKENNPEEDFRYEKQENGTFLVFRVSDNKVIKSVDYSPADLKTILEK